MTSGLLAGPRLNHVNRGGELAAKGIPPLYLITASALG